MKISSPEFKNNETIPLMYTCESDNINPELIFSDVPHATKSLVLIVEDPDAEAKPWVHWLVFNIPPAAKGIEENSIPEGAVEGLCSGNSSGYEGPCPPSGTHHYHFKLYALSKILNISAASDRKAVLKEMHGHVIAEAELVGLYEKTKGTGKSPERRGKEDSKGKKQKI